MFFFVPCSLKMPLYFWMCVIKKKNLWEQFVQKLTTVCVCVSLSVQTAACRSQVGQLGRCSSRWRENSHTSESGSEGWLPQGSLLNPGEPTASHVQTAEGWLMAKWPSRWTSTAPTPHRPSHTTTSTRAASNLHTCTCKSDTCGQTSRYNVNILFKAGFISRLSHSFVSFN